MRINKYIAQSSGLSRRAADTAIANGRVLVDGKTPVAGQDVTESNVVLLDGENLGSPDAYSTIILNKPVGYVCSRNGQGSQTIYNLLPSSLHKLKPVGRLDKDSSGLLLLTNDGQLANQLTHPSFQKIKKYIVELNKELSPQHKNQILNGVLLEDGPSKLQLSGAGASWTVSMSEGRNRQIRRTFTALGYRVTKLHRTHFGQYQLGRLASGKYTAA